MISSKIVLYRPEILYPALFVCTDDSNNELALKLDRERLACSKLMQEIVIRQKVLVNIAARFQPWT